MRIKYVCFGIAVTIAFFLIVFFQHNEISNNNDEYYLFAKNDVLAWQKAIYDENLYFSFLSRRFQEMQNENDFIEIYSKNNRKLFRIYGKGQIEISGKLYTVQEDTIVSFLKKIDSIGIINLVPEKIRLDYFTQKYLKRNHFDDAMVLDSLREDSSIRITMHDGMANISNDFLITSSMHSILGDSDVVVKKFAALNRAEQFIHDFLQKVQLGQ